MLACPPATLTPPWLPHGRNGESSEEAPPHPSGLRTPPPSQEAQTSAPLHASYDTIVAGVGPAGIMAAREASRRGDVLLVDACDLPRDKSCGGMLNAGSQDFLSRFDPMPEEVFLSPRHVHFRFVDWDRGIRRATSLRFLNVDRAAFDHWLLRATLPESVEVQGGCALDGFTQDSTGVTVTLGAADGPVTVRCENLVGADGCRSAVRRNLGIPATAHYVTLQDHVRLEGEIEPFFDCIYIRGIGDQHAYCYVVPKGDLAIVGSVFYPRTKRPGEKQDQVTGIMRSFMPQLGQTVRREAASALYVRAPQDVTPGAGRVLLAGEAGGFMSPTSGEGISYALRTGSLAGEAIALSRPQNALAACEGSTRDISRDIRRRLRWLPIMESRAGRYVAGFVPPAIVDRVTRGL